MKKQLFMAIIAAVFSFVPTYGMNKIVDVTQEDFIKHIDTLSIAMREAHKTFPQNDVKKKEGLITAQNIMKKPLTDLNKMLANLHTLSHMQFCESEHVHFTELHDQLLSMNEKNSDKLIFTPIWFMSASIHLAYLCGATYYCIPGRWNGLLQHCYWLDKKGLLEAQQEMNAQ